jgi:uncharacterized protein (TIGR00299 family) protein
MRHIHLDPLGGIAGDMFVAALLDAFPQLADGAIAAAQELAQVHCALLPHKDHVLSGMRFSVRDHDAHGLSHSHRGDHAHAHWSGIRSAIGGSPLSASVKAHAIDIFTALANAESKVHGVPADDVAFHEVGAADSIADIVAAAWLIDAIGPASWSTSPLPLGGGMIETSHGRLPVPAPATALLLQGLPVIDDGIPGERVTPTGAAILHHLRCGDRQGGLRMASSGIGFGTRTLPGLSNCLRILVFDAHEETHSAHSPPHRTLLVVTFEVDDQSPEDLANGIERLRSLPGVHDVLTMAASGKKGRLTMHVQVLTSPEHEDAVIEACFAQTTTIGLRMQLVAARALPRKLSSADVDGRTIRLKSVRRPGGVTVKAESDDVAGAQTHAERARLRRLAEEGAP